MSVEEYKPTQEQKEYVENAIEENLRSELLRQVMIKDEYRKLYDNLINRYSKLIDERDKEG